MPRTTRVVAPLVRGGGGAFVRTESHGSRRGPGLGDQLAGGGQTIPTNHNAGSSADSGALRPRGVLGPLHVRGQSSPDPMVISILSFPKGRLGASRNLRSCHIGAGAGGGGGMMFHE